MLAMRQKSVCMARIQCCPCQGLQILLVGAHSDNFEQLSRQIAASKQRIVPPAVHFRHQRWGDSGRWKSPVAQTSGLPRQV